MESHIGPGEVLRRPIKYRPDIDGLRAVAVTSVVACHTGMAGFSGGFLGVDIFFVISGYLIGTLVYKEIRGRSFTIARFYERRAKRILPALFGILLFSYVAASLLLSPLEMESFAEGAMSTITSTSNLLFYKQVGYFSPPANLNPLLMTWSLGVEEQFYILFPLLMLLLRKAPWKVQFWSIGALSALSLTLFIWCTRYHPGAAFYLLPMRAWELATGILLAIFEANRSIAKSALPHGIMHGMSILGVVLIGIAIETFDYNSPLPATAVIMPVAGTAMTIAARQGWVNQMLSWRPIVLTGLVSYSWYLWHWPLLSFARICAGGKISAATGAMLGAAALGCAVLSYRLIEQPFRKSKTPTALLLKSYAAAAAVMVIPALLFFATCGWPQRNRQVQKMEMMLREPDDPCLTMFHDTHLRMSADCVPPGQRSAVALLGDSHASVLASTLRSEAGRAGYRLVEFTKVACPALEGVSVAKSSLPDLAHECDQFNRARLAFVINDPNVRVVVIAGHWAVPYLEEKEGTRYVAVDEQSGQVSAGQRDTLLAAGLDRVLTRMERAGKTVYLVEDCPNLTFDPWIAMRTQWIGPRRALATLLTQSQFRYPDGVASGSGLADDREARMVVARVAAAHAQVHRVNLWTALCDPAGCRFAQGSEMLYLDQDHLSQLGAQIGLATFQLPAAF